jgi:hypothetical protein
VVAAITSPPTTKARSSTRTTTTLATPISVIGDLSFNTCFSQLEPKPPSGGQKNRPMRQSAPGAVHKLIAHIKKGLTKPTSAVEGICFNACFSPLEP